MYYVWGIDPILRHPCEGPAILSRVLRIRITKVTRHAHVYSTLQGRSLKMERGIRSKHTPFTSCTKSRLHVSISTLPFSDHQVTHSPSANSRRAASTRSLPAHASPRPWSSRTPIFLEHTHVLPLQCLSACSGYLLTTTSLVWITEHFTLLLEADWSPRLWAIDIYSFDNIPSTHHTPPLLAT